MRSANEESDRHFEDAVVQAGRALSPVLRVSFGRSGNEVDRSQRPSVSATNDLLDCSSEVEPSVEPAVASSGNNPPKVTFNPIGLESADVSDTVVGLNLAVIVDPTVDKNLVEAANEDDPRNMDSIPLSKRQTDQGKAKLPGPVVSVSFKNEDAIQGTPSSSRPQSRVFTTGRTSIFDVETPTTTFAEVDSDKGADSHDASLSPVLPFLRKTGSNLGATTITTDHPRKDGVSSQPVVKFNPSSLIADVGVTFTAPSSSSRPFPTKSTNSDFECSVPEFPTKKKRISTIQSQSTKVSFSPSSLVFTSDSKPKANTDATPKLMEVSFAGLEDSNDITQTSTSDLACRIEMLGILEAEDGNRTPTESDAKSLTPEPHVASDRASLSQALQDVALVSSGYSSKPRGILKKQLPQEESSNEKIVSQCLRVLCKTASDDRERIYDMVRRCASEVFPNLCFEQYFEKGECVSSLCEDNHHYKPKIFSHPKETMWFASLYIITHSGRPYLPIIESLIQHYIKKGKTIKALAFAKCIPRLRDPGCLELAHFIVNALSGIIPRRDIITVILMLNFSELSPFQFTLLSEGLGVFEQNSTHYGELMAFLNFRGYLMPVRLLTKVMADAINYLEGKNETVESIAGFWGRLTPKQKEEVKSVADHFLETFRILPVRNQVEEGGEVTKNVSESLKKRIQFAAEPNIHEFEVFSSPQPILSEDEQFDDGVFSDEEGDETDVEMVKFDSPIERADAIVRVFGESCCTWMLNGQCLDPICTLIHDFSKESLIGSSSNDVYVAADFVVNQAASPSIEVLSIFVEFLAESNEIARVLRFRKCASKLSTDDSLTLTNLVISLLEKQLGRWEAIQKALVPNILHSDSQHHQFYFDHDLLQTVMTEAISTRTALLKCVTKAILQRIVALPPCSNEKFVELTERFTNKFIITGRDMPPLLDIIPKEPIQLDKFGSHLKVALYRGVPNNYFVATTMIQLAVHGRLRDEALDVLYTFLLSNYDRARILTRLLENCKYFHVHSQKSIAHLFGTVGLSTSIRLYEGENVQGAAELFGVLKKFKLNIFTLPKSRGNMTELNLAVIYCNVMADTAHRKDTIDIFLKHCVDPLVESKAECPRELAKLTAKMFDAFTSGRSVEESLKLYNGITMRQRSLLTPIHILEYVESTLRCCLHRPHVPKIRCETLKLYLDVIHSGTPVAFQKVTHRSMFLIALMEITQIPGKFQHVNIIHPLLKKILLKCICYEAYPKFSHEQITLLSSMTVEEIRVYILWWFFLFVRARKKQSISSYPPVTVAIQFDCLQDNSRLPVYASLNAVDSTTVGCAERLSLFIRNTVLEPFPPYNSKGRGKFELDPVVVRGLSEIAIDIMKEHGYIYSDFDHICTFCFDKPNVKIADKL